MYASCVQALHWGFMPKLNLCITSTFLPINHHWWWEDGDALKYWFWYGQLKSLCRKAGDFSRELSAACAEVGTTSWPFESVLGDANESPQVEDLPVLKVICLCSRSAIHEKRECCGCKTFLSFFFVLLFQCLSADCSFTVYANIMSFLKFCFVILYFCSISTCYPLPTVSAVLCVDVNCGVG